MEQSAAGVKASVGEEGTHVGWGLEEKGQLQPWAGCENPRGMKRTFVWGMGQHWQREIGYYIQENYSNK